MFPTMLKLFHPIPID
jgi:hypothetical protein